ncbi:hypothetical protein [Streptomyces violascens]|uniref:hypothetical protein n=1 Tax=Streptomyces violascens TaxID=67381 RepID=UPI003675D64A
MALAVLGALPPALILTPRAMAATVAPVGVSRPDTPAHESADVALTERAAQHTDRYATRTTP